MATTIIRPNGTTSQTVWDTGTMHTVLGDDNNATSGTQNQTTCNFTGTLGDLDSSLSGATINSMTISLRGEPGRAGASTVTFNYVHSSDGAFGSEAENFTGGDQTVITSARTTQQDGSSALTFAYVNALSVKIAPNPQGITAKELFVTVDYTAASGYGHATLGVASANIGSISGVATANIGKVIGVD